ncbi:MAG TPA: hypothetical protein PLH65_00530 [bacterium]|nr:hypothetical protein [bacterium]
MIVIMNANGDNNTKGQKRADKQFRAKHKMKVVGRSALLWERIKQERVVEVKKQLEERKKKNEERSKKNKINRHRRSDSFRQNGSFFNLGEEILRGDYFLRLAADLQGNGCCHG